MRGHSADVWRLCTTSGGATLLSGGNDGAVKVWDILSQLSANPAEASSSLLEYKFADWKALQETQPVEECRFDGYNSETHADKIASTTLRESKVVIDGGEGGRKNQTRRLNGTSGLRVSADHKHMLLVLCSGTVWMINMNPLNQHERIKQNDTLNPPNALGVWIQVAQLGRPVNCMDALFLFNPLPL